MSDQALETAALAGRVGEAIGGLLGEVMQYSAREILCLLQREDLSMPRMTAIMMLRRSGTASISDISRHLNLSLGATSQVVDKLVEAGFVTRAEDPDDRRQKHVALTERGQQFAAEVRRVRVSELTRRLESLPPPLLEHALAVLSDIQAHLRAAPDATSPAEKPKL
jgi:MarR family transcriptional regulator, organic hydroperoxide resistance regulator